MTQSASAGDRPARPIFVATIVFVVTLIVFMPAVRNDFVEWDDLSTIRDNHRIRMIDAATLSWMFTTTYWGHYQPLVWLSYAVDHAWASALLGDGLHPAAYHLTSVFWHAVGAALVALLALFLFGSAGVPPRVAGFCSAISALFYSLHPLRVEAVAWATGRGDVLVAVFLLLSAIAYLRSRGSRRSPRAWFAASLVAYGLALLTRGMAVTFPAVLAVLDVLPLRRLGGRSGWFTAVARRVWLEKLPYVVLAAVFALVATLAKASAASLTPLAWHGPLARLVQACYGLVFYLRKTVIPAKLSPIYELRLPLDVFEPRFIASIVVLAALVAAVLVFGRRRPVLVTAAIAYVLLLVPILGFGQAGKQIAADRYATLASIAIALLLGAWLLSLLRAAPPARAVRIRVGALAVLAGLSLLSVRQIAVWRDNAALWTYAARVSPEASIAQNGFGWVLLQEKRYAEAEPRFRRAIELQPGNEQAHANLWLTLRDQGRTEDLIEALRWSTRMNPGFVDAHYNFGSALMRAGRLEEASAAFRMAIGLRPDHVRARSNLGQILTEQGDIAGAVQQLELAVAADPQDAIALRRLGVALHRQGRRDDAIEYLERAVQIDPRDRGAAEILRKLRTGSE